MNFKEHLFNNIVVSCLTLGLSYGIQFLLVDYAYNNFDYCVTHICCATHNFGVQDQLFMLFHLPFFIGMVITAYLWIDFLKTFQSLEEAKK